MRRRRSGYWCNLMCLRIDLRYNIAKIGYFEGMVGDWQGQNKEELGGMLGMMSEMYYLEVDLVGGDYFVNYEVVKYYLINYYYYNYLDENSFDDFVVVVAVVVVAVVAVAIVVAFVVVVVPVTSSDSSY
jgi:hypothetical protein